MAFQPLAFAAASLLLLSACHEQAAQQATQTPAAAATAAGPQCYAHTSPKDTVQLRLTATQPTVTGQLSYRYFEKDRNQGTISGTLHGDTLLADYTFQSEGTTSVRQVAFVRHGKGWREGYGDVLERNGKTVFKQPHRLQFSSPDALLPVACPQ